VTAKISAVSSAVPHRVQRFSLDTGLYFIIKYKITDYKAIKQQLTHIQTTGGDI
jgi:CRISPR/Cas system CSM-associated protein Csm4 (group 5 of RAMP superfamily)